MEVLKKEYSFQSTSELAKIYARCWYPDTQVKAVFQIMHGMAEHGDRYEDFAKYLCSFGFAVVVDDHLGHGKSVINDDYLGYFGDIGGWDYIVRDERNLTEMIEEEYPDIPVIVFGHSMGSFMVREYLRRYGRDKRIKGAVICGTGGKNPALGFAIKLCSMLKKTKGAMYKSKFVDKLAFGAYNKRIASPKTAFDWLSTDENQVEKYVADKYCGFLFTVAAFKDLFTLLSKVSEDRWFNELNKEMPLLVTAGLEDPVGNYGDGVRWVFDKLKEAGIKDVKIQLYPGMRHEILNETQNAEVYENIKDWAVSKI
ncbi:MAG: lysophospholipase [Clostridiales bacterium]|nr:lysophospholipase [Clostridiales bacterium]